MGRFSKNAAAVVGAALLLSAACGGPVEYGLNAGDCADALNLGATIQYERESCDELHSHEVTGTANGSELSEDVFPGRDALINFADQKCAEFYETYVTSAERRAEFRSTWFGVTSEGLWDTGERGFVCFVDLATGDDHYLGSVNSDDFCLAAKEDTRVGNISIDECAS